MPNEKQNQKSTEISQENTLLMPLERTVCEQIATGDTPHSRRAAALLALDQGATQVEAGERVGLSKGGHAIQLFHHWQRQLG